MMAASRKTPPNFPDAEMGCCRWCGGPITKGRVKTRRWHDGRRGEPSCLSEYLARNDPKAARIYLAKRDGDWCQGCGWSGPPRGVYFAGRWHGYLEVDHRVPLWDGGSNDVRNLWLLCAPCRVRKTSEEARARARRRRTEEHPSPRGLGGGRAARARDVDGLLDFSRERRYTRPMPERKTTPQKRYTIVDRHATVPTHLRPKSTFVSPRYLIWDEQLGRDVDSAVSRFDAVATARLWNDGVFAEAGR